MLSSFVLPAVCPSMATLNETSGVLTSPYYPRSCPSSRSCSWKITASKGERIVFVIKDIHIRNCGSSCTCDYLQIQNGLSSDGISGRRRCRSSKDRGIVYHSTKDVLSVTFVSDSSNHWWYRGFKATYVKVKYDAVTAGKFFSPRGRCLCSWSSDENPFAQETYYSSILDKRQRLQSNWLLKRHTNVNKLWCLVIVHGLMFLNDWQQNYFEICFFKFNPAETTFRYVESYFVCVFVGMFFLFSVN